MSKAERMTVRVEELALTNTLQLTAIVELLEERGIMTQGDVIFSPVMNSGCYL